MSFGNDSFTGSNGTLLTSHTSDSGHAWVKNAASTSDAEISGNAVRCASATGGGVFSLNYLNAAPPSADYRVKGTLNAVTASDTRSGIGVRLSSSAYTGYILRYNGGTGNWEILKFVAGSVTNLGTAAGSVSNGSSTVFELEAIGSAIKAYIGGSSTPSISVTDSSITAAGYAGVRLGGLNSIGADNIDDFSATDTGGGGGSSWASVALTDTNLVSNLSLFNWHVNGSTYLRAFSTGAWLMAAFSGTAWRVTFNTSELTASGVASSEWPRVKYRVDNGSWQSFQVTTGTPTLTVSGLASGTHTIDLYYAASNSYGAWWSATNKYALRIDSVDVSTGGAMVTRTLPTRLILGFGDSILRGKGPDNTLTPSGDATRSWVETLAVALNARQSTIGDSGQGWVTGGSSGEPDFGSTWNYLYSGVSRLTSGLLTPAPDDIVICHGTNDPAGSSSAITSAVSSIVAAIRAAAPTSRIWVLIPFGRFNAAAILSGVGAHTSRTINDMTVHTSTSDAKLYCIDLGSNAAVGVSTYPGASATSQAYDGLHPDYGLYSLVARIAMAMQVTIEGQGYTGPTTTLTIVSGTLVIAS